MKKNVLIIDDSSYSRNIVKVILEASGFDVIGEAKTGEEGLDKIIELKPDIITLDNILPDLTGIDILKIMKQESIFINTIMISAVGQRSAIDEAMSLGAKAYLIKPFSEEQLIQELNRITRN
ncbi:MAG: response regulator [Cyclobacteriaceae bacterium]